MGCVIGELGVWMDGLAGTRNGVAEVLCGYDGS